MSDLKDLGYTKTSPPCEVHVIESTKSVFSFGVYPVDGSNIEPLVQLTIETTGEETPDKLIEGTDESFSESELSAYSIKNKDSFMRTFESWVSRNVPIIEDMHEEPEE